MKTVQVDDRRWPTASFGGSDKPLGLQEETPEEIGELLAEFFAET